MGPTTWPEMSLAFDQIAAAAAQATFALDDLARAFERAKQRRTRDLYPELRALYARGFTVAQMSVELKCSKRKVLKHLTRALHG